jgi:polysaccharide export outer membrane protein
MMAALRSFYPLLLLLLAASSCTSRPKGQLVSMRPQAKQVKVAITPGDELEILVFREKELSNSYQVSLDGTIDFPLVGTVKAVGLQPTELARLLVKKLADGYLRKPYVSVVAKNYKSKRAIYISGQVKKSGMVLTYEQDMPLIKALNMAGGMTPMAARDGVVVTRVVNGKRTVFATPMGQSQSAFYQLKPGDVVFVPERVF